MNWFKDSAALPDGEVIISGYLFKINMKVTPETKYDRIKWLLLNNFIFKPNYEYQHKSEMVMVKLDLIQNASSDEWDRLVDSIEYFINKNNF